MDWSFVLRSATTVLLLGLFAAFIVEDVLGQKENRRRRIWIWTIGMIVLIAIRIGMDWMKNIIEGMYFTGYENRETARIIYSALDNYLSFLLPPLVVLACTLIAYKGRKSVGVFISTFAGFWACVLHEYPFELMRLPFLGGDRGDGLRVRPNVWLNTVLLFLCMAFFYYLFHRYLSPYFKRIIDLTNGELRSFVFIPLLCSMILMIVLSILSGNNIEMTSVDVKSVGLFILIMGVLIFLFGLLYWSLFKGLTLSTQAMAQRVELDVATQIQKSVLPCDFPAFPDRQEFDVHAVMTSAKEVGGDFYDFFLVDENHLAVVIADVSGKGIPAAMFMMTARALLKSLVLSKESLDRVMTIANERLCANNDAGMFVTVWLGIYEISTKKLRFVNAGHNPPLLFNENKWSYLDYKMYKRGIMLGVREGVKYQQNELLLSKGSVLFLYTDGITEANNVKKELYGEQRLKSCMELCGKDKSERIIQRVMESVEVFAGEAEQFDDMTMLALRIQ